MKQMINGVTTQKSIEVMNAHKFNHLLKLAEQNECIMTEFINFLSNLSMETCSVRDDLYGAQNETYIEGWEKKGIKPIDIQKVVQNVSGWLCKTKRLRGFNLQLHLGAF